VLQAEGVQTLAGAQISGKAGSQPAVTGLEASAYIGVKVSCACRAC